MSRSLLPLVRAGKIEALAHITGGGLLENIPRVLPEGCTRSIDADAWPQPRLMAFLQAQGNIEPERDGADLQLRHRHGRSIVAAEDADDVTSALEAAGETVLRIGRVEAGDTGCTVAARAETWSAREDWSATHHG